MKIAYFGHSCFQLISDGGVRIVTDPYTKVGYELPKTLEADIVTVSHEHFDHAYTDAVGGDPVVLDGRGGVFRFEDVEITSFECFHDEEKGRLRGKNQVFKFVINGIKLCHLGDIGERCREDILEKIGETDALMLPVGGTYTIDAEEAKRYADAVGAKTVIPMHFKPSDGALDITSADGFLALCDGEAVETVEYGVKILTKEELTKRKRTVSYFKRVK